LLFLTNQFDQIDTWLQSADAILSEPAGEGGERIRAELLTLRSFLTQEGAERALELAHQAAEIAPVGNVLIQGLIQTALAAGYHELGDIRRAIDASEAAIPLHWEAGNVVAALMATTDIVLLCRAQGPLERAYGLCNRMSRGRRKPIWRAFRR
jgi:ATP/maltotriose-dependent transcriptional regulator MalT